MITKVEIEEAARKDIECRKDFIPVNPTRRDQGFAIKDAFERGALWMQKEIIEAADAEYEAWVKDIPPFPVTAEKAYQAARLSAMSEMKSSNDDTNSTIASLKSDLEWALSKNHNYDRVQEIKKKWGLE